jgi:hypothetical protein
MIELEIWHKAEKMQSRKQRKQNKYKELQEDFQGNTSGRIDVLESLLNVHTCKCHRNPKEKVNRIQIDSRESC